jgi:Ca2+-binding RTX toxin-like protein
LGDVGDPQADLPLAARAHPTFADIDGDGDFDALVGDVYGNTQLFRNQTPLPPSINFLPAQSNPFGLTNVGFHAASTFADLDRDGDLDGFVGNSAGDILFYRNTGTVTNPIFATPVTNPFGLNTLGSPVRPTFVDIDGDGDLDAFVENSIGDTYFYRNTGKATEPIFATPTTNPFGLSNVGISARVTFADIDEDGDFDALAGTFEGNTLFFRNTGTVNNPIFAAPITNPFGLTDVGFVAKPTFFDVDSDGDLDGFVSNSVGDTLFYQNTGSATNPIFATPITNPLGLTNLGNFANNLAFVDINGDGAADAFAGTGDGNTLFFLANRAPVINSPITATLNEDDPISGFNLLSNAIDLDRGNSLTISNLTLTSGDNRGITITGNNLNVDPAAYSSLLIGQSSVIVYSYNITDAQGGSTPQTATITIQGTRNDFNGTSGNDTLTGSSFADLINGFAGNDSLIGAAGNDTIIGGTGNDTLRGDTGADSLVGGAGNDLYFVDNLGDVVSENSNEGTDKVQSTITYILGDNLENLYLLGSNPINGTGNALNNRIKGNNAANILGGGSGNDTLTGGSGNDVLVGGLGNDSLIGGKGADNFTFNAPNEGIDRLSDFSLSQGDRIAISASGFGGGLVAGVALTSEQFVLGSTAIDASDRLIYNSATGALFYDADGTGAISAVQIATLNNRALINNSHFTVI